MQPQPVPDHQIPALPNPIPVVPNPIPRPSLQKPSRLPGSRNKPKDLLTSAHHMHPDTSQEQPEKFVFAIDLKENADAPF